MPYYFRTPFSIGGPLTPRVKFLMIACVVGFLLQAAIGAKLYYYLGLVPVLFWGKFFVWQLVTYIFLHGGFW